MPDQDGVELRWILAVIRRWLWLIVVCALLAGGTAFLVTSRMVPEYEATAILLIQPAQDTRSTEYSVLVAGERLALTYSEMLKGQPVLETVISNNQLNETAEQLARRVAAQPIRDTQLVRLTVKDASPRQAVLLANAIAEEFTQYIQTLQVERYAGTLDNMQAQMDVITLQMEELQAELDALNDQKVDNEAQLAQLESLLADYNSRDQQLQQEYRSLELTVSTLTDSISIAEAARATSTTAPITATVSLLFDQTSVAGTGSYSVETYERMLVSRPVLESAITKLGLDMDPGVLALQINVAAVPGTQLIQLNVADLDISRAILLADTIADVFIDQMQTLQEKPYTDRMDGIQAQMDLLQLRIAGTQVDIASVTSENLEVRTQIESLQSQLAEYRSDYRTLQQDYGQMQLTTANAADAVVIAEPATVADPASQHRLLYIALATAVGAAIALGTGFLLEYLNDVVRTPDDVTQISGMSTLGSIGWIRENGTELIAIKEPRSPVSEAFRVLATNIRMSTLDLPLCTILVTSPHARTGKSLVAANLAAVLAQRELRVVVVDADLRLPRMHELFELEQGKGLTGALLNGNPSQELKPVSIYGLKVLTSGNLPPNPAEVVASRRMANLLEEMAKMADVVLIDCPPVLPVADASILASIVDGVVLVVQADRTRRQEMRDAVENLHKVGGRLIGVVLNGVTSRGDRYYRYYGGKDSKKSHGRQRQKGSSKSKTDIFVDAEPQGRKSRQGEPDFNAVKKNLP